MDDNGFQRRGATSGQTVEGGRSSTSRPATCCVRSTTAEAGAEAPWRLKQNYLVDIRMIRHGRVDEEALQFTKHHASVAASV